MFVWSKKTVPGKVQQKEIHWTLHGSSMVEMIVS